MTGNRVETHAQKLREAIARGEKVDGTGPIEPGTLEKLDAELALTFAEHFSFQETQAWAHATGILSAEEAWTVYRAVGGDPDNPEDYPEAFGEPFEPGASYDPEANGGWATGTDLALKVTITNLMGQLLGMKLRAAGVRV